MQQEGTLGGRFALLLVGLEEGWWEWRDGVTLHGNDKWLQVSPGITQSYGLFEDCILSVKAHLIPEIISLLEIIISFQMFKTFWPATSKLN